MNSLRSSWFVFWAALAAPLTCASAAMADPGSELAPQTSGGATTSTAEKKPSKEASKDAASDNEAPTKTAKKKRSKKKRTAEKRADKKKRSRKKASTKRAAKPKPKPRASGSKPGEPDAAVRRILTGDYPDHSTKAPEESPELAAMRQLDHELFPPATAPTSSPWDLVLRLSNDEPTIDSSGLPVNASNGEAPNTEAKDLSWVTTLAKPDFPVRFDPAVVKYLEYYRDNKRGRALLRGWVARSGRYRDVVLKLLREYQMPEDVLWLALVESAFNSTIHSHAGAAGLWQFMPATGRIYGLTVNRRIDERLDPERSTHAALKHLSDLYKRFGSWELSFAAYNMGYGGMLSSIRKYNSNDYWELRRLEAAMPYETALYVPKIMAIAIAAKNCPVFHCSDVKLDEPLPFDEVAVGPGVKLQQVAKAAGTTPEKIAELNPHIIGSRTPPLEQSPTPRTFWTVHVPTGTGTKAQKELPASGKVRKLATHRVRWGESLDHIASVYDTSTGYIERLNDFYPRESPRPGDFVFVPHRSPEVLAAAHQAHAQDDQAPAGQDPKEVAVITAQPFAFADKQRFFYEAVYGDDVPSVARACGVATSDLVRWNHLDPTARLQNGMRLQLFLAPGTTLDNVVLHRPKEYEVVMVGSTPFYAHFVGRKGRTRIEVTVRDGDTWKQLSGRYGLSVGMLERINHRSRHSKLAAGDKVVVYARHELLSDAPTGSSGQETAGSSR